MSNEIGKREYKSIINGYNQLTRNQQQLFREEFEYKMVVYSPSGWSKVLRGERQYTPGSTEIVEALFKKFGVTQNIWSAPIKKLPKGFNRL